MPLRLFAAVHHLVLSGVAPDALSGRLRRLRRRARRARGRAAGSARDARRADERGAALRDAVADVPRRGGARPALPLELIELGPSAGLNLLVDRYRYRYANGSFGVGRRARSSSTVDERGGRVPAALLEHDARRPASAWDRPRADRRDHRGRLPPAAELPLARASTSASRGSTPRSRRSRRAPEPPELIAGDYIDVLPGAPRGAPGGCADGRLRDLLDRSTSPEVAHDELAEALEAAAADGTAARLGLGAPLGARGRRPTRRSSSSCASGRGRRRSSLASTPTATGSTGAP